MHKTKQVVFIPLFVSAVLNISCLGQNPATARDESTTIIGIYSGDGAAKGCVIPAENRFRWMGCETKRISADDINRSKISDIDIFYFPGGTSAPFLRDIDEKRNKFYSLNNRPAIIACEYGKGKVFLTGPHPQWEEDGDRDGIDAFKEFDDRVSDWELMKHADDWCLGK